MTHPGREQKTAPVGDQDFSPSAQEADTHRVAETAVLVPREPTPEMLEPFARVLCSALDLDPDEPVAPHGEWPQWYDNCQPLAVAFRAMLAAAPKATTANAVGTDDREAGGSAQKALPETPVGWQDISTESDNAR